MFPTEAFRGTVERFIAILKALEIRHYLTGGVVSVAWGEPRLAQDIDIVIDRLGAIARVEELANGIRAAGYFTDEPSMRTAIHTGKPFPLIDQVEVLKLAVYPRELIPCELRLSRRGGFSRQLDRHRLPPRCRFVQNPVHPPWQPQEPARSPADLWSTLHSRASGLADIRPASESGLPARGSPRGIRRAPRLIRRPAYHRQNRFATATETVANAVCRLFPAVAPPCFSLARLRCSASPRCFPQECPHGGPVGSRDQQGECQHVVVAGGDLR